MCMTNGPRSLDSEDFLGDDGMVCTADILEEAVLTPIRLCFPTTLSQVVSSHGRACNIHICMAGGQIFLNDCLNDARYSFRDDCSRARIS